MNCDQCGARLPNAGAYVDHLYDNPTHATPTRHEHPADWNWNQIGR